MILEVFSYLNEVGRNRFSLWKKKMDNIIRLISVRTRPTPTIVLLVLMHVDDS